MQLGLATDVNKILVLGAGASTDYGLPTWKELGLLIKKDIDKDVKNKYKYKREISEWIDKVGDEKIYDTIDKCITNESFSPKYPNSPKIENELFTVMNNIFKNRYKKNNEGWITKLNDKILKNPGMEESLAFVNFNYDDVLEKNFLDFSYLHSKARELTYSQRLAELSSVLARALYPHGKFSKGQESHLSIEMQTIKSDHSEYLDVVSCYEGDKHSIYKKGDTFELYILGLGGGLTVNLDRITFPYNSISSVHVTITDPKKNPEIVSFLSERYKTSQILTYSSCKELVTKCFDELS